MYSAAIPRFACLLFVLMSAKEPAFATMADRLGQPDRNAEVKASVNQLKSSENRPYTLFEYKTPTKDSVPHIIAIAPDDTVWFSESGGKFAGPFLNVPPVGNIARFDVAGSVSEWAVSGPETSPMGVAFDRDQTLWCA